MSFCVQLLDISCHDISFDIEEILYNAFLLLIMGGTRVRKFLRQWAYEQILYYYLHGVQFANLFR